MSVSAKPLVELLDLEQIDTTLFRGRQPDTDRQRVFGGQVIAYAAMDTGREVTWIPSYGPEMRGGTANCTVVIADDEIGSPLVKSPPLAVALNLPSFDKYEEMLAPGGTLIVNQSMVDRGPKREDINVVMVPCNEIAEEIGSKKLLNMVAIGAVS